MPPKLSHPDDHRVVSPVHSAMLYPITARSSNLQIASCAPDVQPTTSRPPLQFTRHDRRGTRERRQNIRNHDYVPYPPPNYLLTEALGIEF